MRPTLRLLLALLLIGLSGVSSAQLNRYYYYSKTQRQFVKGEYTAAIATINVFLEHNPDDDIALYFRALCKYNLSDYRGALLDLDRTLAHKPFMVETLTLRGATQNQLDRPQKALPDIQLALELRPNDREIAYLRGITYFLLKDYKRATDDFTATLNAAPGHLDARINRGTAMLLLNDTTAALEDYRQATRTNPFSPAPYINIARILYERKQLDEALEALNEALRIEPNSHGALLIKALVQHGLGLPEQAIETLSHSLQLAPRNSLALYNRALLYTEKEEWKKALADYQNAASISPTNVFIQFNAGLLYLQLKNYPMAAESFSRAIALYPYFARAYALRAESNLALGNKAQAQHDLDSAQHLLQRHQAGELDHWSDTSANFSRLIAFEYDFSTHSSMAIPMASESTDLLPLASIHVAQKQPLTEWSPALRLNARCEAPFFALVVPTEDTIAHLDLSLFPPLNNIHAINLVRAISFAEAQDYASALLVLDSIPQHSEAYPLARLVRATTRISQIRFTPQIATPISLSGFNKPTTQTALDYSEPIEMLLRLQKAYPSPYIDYTIATAYYLSRDLKRAEHHLNLALESAPDFAPALYNRGLVRLLLQKQNLACVDLSRAGELGVDAAYRVIAKHCTNR